MLPGYYQFKQLVDNKNIEFSNKKFNNLIKKINFIQILKNLEDYGEIIQKINQSKIVIIQPYIEMNLKYFITCFDNYLIIINLNDSEMMNTFFSNINKEQTKIFFLSNSMEDFPEISQLKVFDQSKCSKLSDTFIREIEEFVIRFQISEKYKYSIKKFWNIVNKCIAGYLIQKSYMKCKYDRIEHIISNYEKEEEIIFDEKDFIFLRNIYSSQSSNTSLQYCIEKELLCAVKSTSYEINDKLENREINNYKCMKHPFIPIYYGYFVHNNFKNRVIEFIDGNTLEEIKNLNLSYDQKIEIVLDIIYIFQYLHYKQFIYRDLKPNNLMITYDQIILIDFDRMIKDCQDDNKNSFTMYLNGNFLAPEIVETGIPSLKSDIYSIGMIIYYIFMEKYPIIIDQNEEVNESPYEDFRQKYSNIYDIFLKCTNKKKIIDLQ